MYYTHSINCLFLPINRLAFLSHRKTNIGHRSCRHKCYECRLPENLVYRIDATATATQLHMSRSAFLALAVEREMVD
ncbi:MAG: hypothetical protein EPN62_04780 [Candidimonas sp.]|nr:MAG: hypothetical protein EPN77_02555 [Candidimonas sp.]TAM25140.1 MAG: hypothetical protein EPN62_04780 [Candidimonas sp.]